MIKKLALLTFISYFLAGCSLISNDTAHKPDVRKIEIESTKGKEKPKQVKRQPKAKSPSQVEEEEPISTTTTEPVEQEELDSSCSYEPFELEKSLRELASKSTIMFTPRQPNLSMVYYVSSDKNVCAEGLSLTSILKDEISNSSRFNLISNSLEQRIKNQLRQSSNAYMIRIAKAQNIDYVLSGQVKSQGKGAKLMLKITDLKSGSIVWQCSSNL